MRVIKFIFSSIFLIFLLSAVVFLVFREITLLTATSQIKGALKTLRKIERDPTEYYYQCRNKGGDEDEAVPEIFQLRFTDDVNYRLEVICRQFPLDPIVVDERRLPYLVKKIKGSSGLIWGEEKSVLGVEILGRKASIVVLDEKMDVIGYSLDFGVTPVATCQSYGFSCCQEEVSKGVGDQLFETLDCPRSCFDACQSRPVILSFASDPFYESKTRVATIKKGVEISFSYVIDSGDEDLRAAKISFGDGEEYDFTDTTGRVAHKYICNSKSCIYEAVISAIDAKNVDSVYTDISKITVKVE